MSLPAFVFLHGWGQSAQTWHAQLEHFGKDGVVFAPNLPGHGGAPDAPPERWLDVLLGGIETELPDGPLLIVGWSLGGMLGMQLAERLGQRVAGLVLASSTPCFRTRADWPHGCDDAVFVQFRDSLEADAPRLLDRFFALMLQGDELERRQYLALVRAAVDRRKPATLAGLRGGLQLLDTLDLREVLPRLDLPVLLVHGEHDAVTPVGAARSMADILPRAELRVAKSGHAPHLTRPDEFNAWLEEWCRNSLSIAAR